jgi:uncharacterized protein YcfL
MVKTNIRHRRAFPIRICDFLILEAVSPLRDGHIVFFNQQTVVVNTEVFEAMGAAQTSPIKSNNVKKRVASWIKEQELKIHYQKC